MGATVTTVGALVSEYVEGLAVTADATRTPLTAACRQVQGKGDYYKYLAQSADNASSTTYSEGAAPSASGQASFSKLYFGKDGNYVRTMFSITGHAIDSCRDGDYNPLAIEAESARRKHMAYEEALFVASFQNAIDSAGSYGGVLRATANTASYEEDIGSTALSIEDMETLYDTLLSSPIGANVGAMNWFANPVTQRTVANLVAPQTNRVLQYQAGMNVEASVGAGALTVMNRPFNTIFGMTNAYILFSDPNDMEVVTFRDVQVDEMAKVDDSYNFMITSCRLFVHRNPRHAGKIWT
jgi:hypothetical protein